MRLRETTVSKRTSKSSIALTLGALGVVYGDIGTSPIYALNESVRAAGISEQNVIAVVSLIVWSLFSIVSIKYLLFVLRADNKGEGGILALFALLPKELKHRRTLKSVSVVILMFLAAALLFADGFLTPAISVLSATEGLKSIDPNLSQLVIPITVIILASLFALQFKGTHRIGKVFGPIMFIWFSVIGFLGLRQLVQSTEILTALNPIHALNFFISNGWQSVLVMSSVMLAITGVEALYADLGHYGKNPIRLGWFGLVGISLTLSYLGQGALLLEDPNKLGASFFGQVEGAASSISLVVLSTLATIIASQALISGVASLAFQGIQLGLLPRMKVIHTSSEQRGQIYVPFINAIVGVGAILLVVVFETSSAIAGAYAFAISGTMLATTIVMSIIVVNNWRIPKLVAFPLIGFFLIIDLMFFVSTATKIPSGAWLPVVIGILVATMMWIWVKGREVMFGQLRAQSINWSKVQSLRETKAVTIRDYTGVYLSAVIGAVPKALEQQIKVLGSMPEKIVVVRFTTTEEPFSESPPNISQIYPNIIDIEIFEGFLEHKNLPRALSNKVFQDLFTESDCVYFLSKRQIQKSRKVGLNRFEELVFAALHRNSAAASDYFKLPTERVITISVQVDV